MVTFLALTAVLLAAEPQTGVEAVSTTDGGEVPIAAPQATPKLAPVLAPEMLEGDAGVQSDGGVTLSAKPSLSVYEVNFPIEASITASTLGLALMVDLIQPSLQGDLSCRNGVGDARCNPNDLSPIDRYSVGKRSAAWKLTSDITLYFAIGLPIAYLALESFVLPSKTPWMDFFNDALVMAESMALTAAMTTVLKYAFRRPRPSRYLAVDPDATFDHELSLPSGHTAMVTAATTAFTTTVFLRHPESPLRWVALSAGILLSGLAGLGRIESGNHFFTDVVTGVFVGGFAGFVVPFWHRKKLPVTPQVSVNPTTGSAAFSLSGNF